VQAVAVVVLLKRIFICLPVHTQSRWVVVVLHDLPIIRLEQPELLHLFPLVLLVSLLLPVSTGEVQTVD